jgi:hypothetical protein
MANPEEPFTDERALTWPLDRRHARLETMVSELARHEIKGLCPTAVPAPQGQEACGPQADLVGTKDSRSMPFLEWLRKPEGQSDSSQTRNN